MPRTLEDFAKELDADIPKNIISKRKGNEEGTFQLDYLETWYVIDRLNQVFGNLSWSSETVAIQFIEGPSKPTYWAKVRITIRTANDLIVKEGCGYGNDINSLNPHEMAIKEAESDAFKRAAMKFGRSMGLALYDKERKYVSGDKAFTSKSTSKPANASVGNKVSEASKTEKATIKIPAQKDQLIGTVSNLSKVVAAKRKMSVSEQKEYLTKTFKAEKKEDLNVTQLQELASYLATKANLQPTIQEK